jgi:phosphoglycolate phosphatase
LQALETLHKAGYKMALATSKPMHYASRIIEKFGFAKYLVSEYEPIRPGYEPKKTDMIEKGIRLLGASKEECLMVGDRMYDIVGAREVGVDVAALDVGYAQEGEFTTYPPDYYFKDFTQLVAALLEKTE